MGSKQAVGLPTVASAEDRLRRQIAERFIRPDRNTAAKAFAKTYRYDPVAFAHDCFNWRPNEGLTPYQEEIMAALIEKKRVAIRGPHGLGKSALASLLILWFALTRDADETDWKIPTTASAWRQLTKFLWPEVGKWIRRLRWERIGREPFNSRTEAMKQSLSLQYGESFAAASDTPDLLEGAHADSLLYIFDESKMIPDATFDAAEGAFSGAGADTANEAYAFVISTPGDPNGRFYDIHARKPGFEDWWARHVTLDECVKAGRISAEWALQREKQWGRQSPIFQRRCLGEFAAGDESSVIPLSWVEMAQDRYRDWRDSQAEKPDFVCVGVDVARSGEDKTVFALRYGDMISELRRSSREDTMATTGKTVGILQANGGMAVVDVIGIGAGVVDRLREQGLPVTAFHSGEKTEDRDKSGELSFINKRAAAWWHLRELLDPANGEKLMLLDDDMLTGDLVAPHWKMSSNGKIQVESKDEIRDRIGRSTDDGDAVVMAFYVGSGPTLPFGWITLPEEAVA